MLTNVKMSDHSKIQSACILYVHPGGGGGGGGGGALFKLLSGGVPLTL